MDNRQNKMAKGINKLVPDIRFLLSKVLRTVFMKSLRAAIAEQNLDKIYLQLEKIVPDISEQYSCLKLDNEYLVVNVRGLHSFQISLVNEAISMLDRNSLTIVDIGDSCGTHIQYIKGIHKNKELRGLSINLDEKAVNKIKSKGLEAMLSKAEDLNIHAVKADIFLSFEMLEHLSDPIKFLHQLAQKTSCEFFVITVPFMRKSRVALHHIRRDSREMATAENTHIFELSPVDWRLIFKHSGWDVVSEKIYYQYPKKNILSFTRLLWMKYDYEGFYGVILKRDDTWSSLYKDW